MVSTLKARTSTRHAKPLAQPTVAASGWECDFCHKRFVREAWFLSHLCEAKRRRLQRDDKPVRLAYAAYARFYAKRMAKRSKPQSYDDFARSSLYASFVAFGRYLVGINALNPLLFIEFLIETQVGIKRWTEPGLYERYVRELNKVETPTEAVERNFLLMQQWAMETGEPWTEFFRKVHPVQATMWIQSGRISPWLIFAAPSAEDMLLRLSPEQVGLVNAVIEPGFWRAKLDRQADAVEAIRHELDAAGI